MTVRLRWRDRRKMAFRADPHEGGSLTSGRSSKEDEPALNEMVIWLRGQKEDFIFEILRGAKQGEFKTVWMQDYLIELSKAMEASYVFSEGSPTKTRDGNDFGG